MDLGVFEPVLLCVLENHTLILNEADDGVLPDGRLEILRHDLKDPLLQTDTESS